MPTAPTGAAAVPLAATFIHGRPPGPLIMITKPSFVYEGTALVFLTSASILPYGLLLTKPLVLVLRVPTARLIPIILVLSSVGARRRLTRIRRRPCRAAPA